MLFCDHAMSLGYLVHYVINFMHVRQAHNGKNISRITFSTNYLFVLDFLYNIKSRDSSLQVRFFFTTPIMLFCQHKMSLDFLVDFVLS